MNTKATKIDRSNIMILAFLLDGYCTALRQSVSLSLQLGTATLEILQKLHSEFLSISSGTSVELLPKIDATSPPSDILTFAEMLRSMCTAFLSPDETLQRQRAIGFQQ